MNPQIIHHTPNLLGRDLVVGDIHGCFSKLQAQLDSINFNPEKDRLFQVGDLVDRGPESPSVLSWLEKPWFFPIRGNHEDMLMLFWANHIPADIYRRNGGGWFIDLPRESRLPYAQAFAALPLARQIGDVAIVHASVTTPTWEEFLKGVENFSSEAIIEKALWARDRIIDPDRFPPIQGIKAVIVGHNTISHPTWVQNVLHIDTGAWWQGGEYKRQFPIINLSTLKEETK